MKCFTKFIPICDGHYYGPTLAGVRPFSCDIAEEHIQGVACINGFLLIFPPCPDMSRFVPIVVPFSLSIEGVWP